LVEINLCHFLLHSSLLQNFVSRTAEPNCTKIQQDSSGDTRSWVDRWVCVIWTVQVIPGRGWTDGWVWSEQFRWYQVVGGQMGVIW